VKIVQFSEPGPPSVLRYVDAPVPPLKDDDVLVRAEYVGVGIPDVLIRSGLYNWMPPLPAVPGTEMSGIIEKIGAGVTSLKVGQRVIVSARERKHRGGCYAEYSATPAHSVFPLPDNVDLKEAAALANYQVAYHLLNDCVQIIRGQSVLVYAAAGGVGSAIIDLALSAGLHVIGVCSGPRKVEFVKLLGAQIVIDRQGTNVAEAVQAATEQRGVNLILDPIGGPTFADNFSLLAPFGFVVSYGRLAGNPPDDAMKPLLGNLGKCGAVRIFSMHVFDDWPEKRRQAMASLIESLGKSAIRPRVQAVLPLSEARKAHEMLESGQIIGKLLLRP
jgi:NADPH:quinone reductase